jgi:hypothetical protein
MSLKITSWNIEHAERLLGEQPTPTVQNRRTRIFDTLTEIDPDILCMLEGPRGEQDVDAFCTQVLQGRWEPVMLRLPDEPLGSHDKEYQIKGNQWIWFLVKPGLKDRCRLQPVTTWQSFVEAKDWTVYFWGEEKSARHSHYRHPQVLLFDLGNSRQLELIGVHLKSKINKLPIKRDADGNLTGDYLRVALKARIELATEARNVRQYIEAKFDQSVDPGIVVMGDCNDGPGTDAFETRYLFFDLISNIQGDVLVSEKFFNHALFDYPGHLRWSAKYRDDVLNIPASKNPLLLDHILMSQPLCRGDLLLKVNEHAGLVEHEAYERNNAGASSNARTSDHRPVSCKFDDNP